MKRVRIPKPGDMIRLVEKYDSQVDWISYVNLDPLDIEEVMLERGCYTVLASVNAGWNSDQKNGHTMALLIVGGPCRNVVWIDSGVAEVLVSPATRKAKKSC